MKVRVLFFGQTTDITGKSLEEMSLNDKTVLGDLIELLNTENQELSKLNLKWAVNQEFVSEEQELKNGDEVAVMPPFAGG
ncbi:MAG: molybdopterin synthase sulfur carrier subunit [Crocinitomicaceae bacterium]|nr:molybdopterin synthase sulfur carrier subunit [Crocinitomicaceae bacterium]|tara:strand:+ start:311 stop:550 length:240 start_codon:yes stop_codon:yes gene_type:complete